MMERRMWRDASFGIADKVWRINGPYLLLLCLLAGIGYAALYSVGGGPGPYAERHLLRFGIGLVLMIAIALIDIRFIARLSWPLYALGIGMLLLVLRFGHVGKGAQRWLEVGGMEVQPSEMMKIALILALAAWFRNASWERIGNPLFVLPPLAAVLAPAALILKEPNLGNAVITLALGGMMCLAAGVRLWKFALIAVAVGFAAPMAFHHLHGYQRARIETFLNPEADPLGAGYNIIQSKIALGSGGLWGQGFMHGSQAHLNFLPEKQTDFIYATLAEEFGLVGGVAVIGVLLLIVLGAMLMALRCRHQYGRLVAFGIAVNFFLYSFVNIAMVMGAIPVGGVPLPLVSHGGSAMLTVMIGFGILMSVHVHRDVEFAEREAEP